MAGIPIGYIAYPTELTDKSWQKSKGVLAKAKKTGIGDLLKKGEALYKKLDFTAIDPRTNNPRNKAELKKATDNAKAFYKANFLPVMEHMEKIKAHAGKVEKENSALLKGAKSGIRDVIAKAEHFRMTLKSLDLEGAIKEAETRIETRQKLAAKLLNDSLGKFAVGAKAFLAAPTPASWEKNIKQQGRSVSNSVRELEDYNAAFWKQFQKFQGFDVSTLGLDTKDDAKFAAESTKLVKAAVDQVKKIAAFKP